MEYNNRAVRRQDRLLPEEEAVSLLEHAEYGVLSLFAGEEEGAYGIPLNFVWDKQNSLYFHCAPEGHKLRLMARNKQVSFCIVGKTEVVPSCFSANYESVVIKGAATCDLPEDERRHALALLIDKYAPAYKETGVKYAEKSFFRTAIIRLDIRTVSGKSKRIGG